MAVLAWPLERNHIRRGFKNHTFGMVRNGGKRPHQGWDLEAVPGTRCYAIADGVIEIAGKDKDYGSFVLLKFPYQGRTFYAMYAHLSMPAVYKGQAVQRGDLVGLTGNSGNASSMYGDDQHLHFEIRTTLMVGKGLVDRVDPATLFGRAPTGWTFYEAHGQKRPLTGAGLKVRNVNVRESLE